MNPQSTIERRRKETRFRRGWLSQLPVLAAVLVTGVLVGVVFALLLFERTPETVPAESEVEMPGDDSAEAGFVRDMIIHHAQAVEMSESVRDRTESEEIRNLAANIALTQQAEIGQMRGWLEVWGLSASGSEPAMTWMGHPTEGRMPGMASPEEIDALQTAPPKEADIRFLQLMIPHHEAALPMAEAILEKTDRSEVERLATAIVASQQAEIKLMQNFLRTRGIPVESSPVHDAGPHGGD